MLRIGSFATGKRMEKLCRNFLQGKHNRIAHILARSNCNDRMVSPLCNGYLLFGDILEGNEIMKFMCQI